MTTKDYKPPMRPHLEPATPARIRISREYGLSLGLNEADRDTLNRELVSQSICPSRFWFRDTPEVRRILKVAQERKP